MMCFSRFYKYGIKSAWLKIHRIINHRTLRDGSIEYLVKWRDLAYDQATWEDEDEDIEGLKTAVEYYNDLRMSCNADGETVLMKIILLFMITISPIISSTVVNVNSLWTKFFFSSFFGT